MDESILVSIKKLLGIHQDYDEFDVDVIISINSVFSTLYQIGFEPARDYSISGPDEKWTDLCEDPGLINLLKPYIYQKVRLIFDPPNNSFLLNSIQDQIRELEWRINIQAEGGFEDAT